MIITLIFILMLILSIVLSVIYFKDWVPVWFDDASFFFGIIGSIGTVICVVGILVNVAFVNIDYEDKLKEREMLEYRIENYENAVGNELLYADIVEFNEEVRHAKRYSDNPWTSWFSNWKIAEIDCIDVKNLNLKGE